MDRSVMERWCERGILGLTLAILVSMPLAFGGRPQQAVGSRVDFWLLDPFLLAQWLMVPLLGLWLCRIWLHPKLRLLWPPICWAVLAFVVYAVARYRTADIEYLARQELLHILVYAFLFFAIVNNLHRQEAIQAIGLTLIFTAMAIALYADGQFLSGSNRVWHTFSLSRYQGSGTYISPNHLAGFLEMLLPLGMAYALMGRFKPLTKVLLGYASLAILSGIVVSVSRGGWASTLVALVLFFAALMTRRAYRLPALALVAVLLALGFWVVPKSEVFRMRVRQLATDGQFHDDARFALWRPALRAWETDVWWGVGPAHYDYRFRQYRPMELQVRADRAHNDILNALVDWGLAGAGLIASAWVLLFLGVRKSWRYVRTANRDLGGSAGGSKSAFLLGASLGLVAILCHSLVDFNMYIPANALLAVALMAMLSSHLRFASDRYWVSSRLWVKALASTALAAGLSCLAWQAWRHTAENFWLARAAAAQSVSTAQAGLLEKAFAAEPRNPLTACAIGEIYRRQSSEGDDGYQQLATRAMEWFARARKLNPWDSICNLGYGWCLDWLDRSDEAGPFFDRADQLDPNSYFAAAWIGIHYLKRGEYAAARSWMERSRELEGYAIKSGGLLDCGFYLDLINRHLMEAATNGAPAGPPAAKGAPK